MKIKIYKGEHLNRASRYLNLFGYSQYSQHNEDGLLARIFHLIGKTKRPLVVDIGAGDGVSLSNSRCLILGGWDGELFEADPVRFQALAQLYPEENVHCYCRLVRHIDAVLDDVPYVFDLLLVDVDGDDYHLWANMEEYKPNVVVIEFNPTLSNDIELIPEKGDQCGCSLRALINLGIRKGYELAATTLTNAIFVTREHFEKLGIADNSIYALHDDWAYTTQLFQSYDGRAFIVGRSQHLWSDGQLDMHDIQDRIGRAI